MNEKKVLVINLCNHNFAGGIEKFSYNLFLILKELGYKIYEYSTCHNPHLMVREKLDFVNQIDVEKKFYLYEVNIFEKIKSYGYLRFLSMLFNDLKTFNYQKQQLKKISKQFDLIIDNLNVFNYLEDKDCVNLVWVQHFDFKYLKSKAIFGRKILKFFKNIKFPYLNVKRKILHSNYSIDQYQKLFSIKHFKNSKFYPIPWSANSYIDISLNDINIDQKFNGNIAILGRLNDVNMKRIDLANKIAKYLNKKIYAYGTIGENFNKKYKYINFCGPYSSNDLSKIMNDTSCVLITSDTEGLPYVGLEAIQHLTPLIVRNTYANAEFLLKNNNGLLLDKKLSAKKIANKINEFFSNKQNYKNAILQTLKFQKELKNYNAVEKWKQLIKQIESE